MSETHELFSTIADVVEEHTSDEGIDVPNVYVTLVEALKGDPDMNLERWELLKLSINNQFLMFNQLVDAEIEQFKSS